MPRRGSKGSRQLAKELIATPAEEIGYVCSCASCREAIATAEEILMSGKFGCVTHAAGVSLAMWAITQKILLNQTSITHYGINELANKIVVSINQYGRDDDRIGRLIQHPNKVKQPSKGKIV